jgi:hypothetical protein
MSLRPALLTTIAIGIILRIIFGLMFIEAQYELETLFYKYLLVFTGLGLIVIALRKVLTFYSVLRYTR